MGKGLFDTEVAWSAVHICPYCKNFPGSEEDRDTDHIFGGTPGNECEQLIDDLLNNEDEIDWICEEVAPEENGFFVKKCKYYKRIFIDFNEYLNSSMWAEKKKGILERDGYKCVLCGSAKNLHVHHITYENLPFEKDEDLITVCNKCHEKLHKMDIARKRK